MKATDKKPLMVRLDPAVHKALKVRAAREATSIQALVEVAITLMLRQRPGVVVYPPRKGGRP